MASKMDSAERSNNTSVMILGLFFGDIYVPCQPKRKTLFIVRFSNIDMHAL
jgi:hypothetical protein